MNELVCDSISSYKIIPMSGIHVVLGQDSSIALCKWKPFSTNYRRFWHTNFGISTSASLFYSV